MNPYAAGFITAITTLLVIVVIMLALGLCMMGGGDGGIKPRHIAVAIAIPLILGPIGGLSLVNERPISEYVTPTTTTVIGVTRDKSSTLVHTSNDCSIRQSTRNAPAVGEQITVYKDGATCSTSGGTPVSHTRAWTANDWMGWSLCFIAHLLVAGLLIREGRKK